MTQYNIVVEQLLRVNQQDLDMLCSSCLCFLHRMQCADVLADRDTDGQWTIAKAVFSGTVNGTVTLVRTTTVVQWLAL